jgi:hypothetical protein
LEVLDQLCLKLVQTVKVTFFDSLYEWLPFFIVACYVGDLVLKQEVFHLDFTDLLVVDHPSFLVPTAFPELVKDTQTKDEP